MDEPKQGYYGGQIAAPVFKQVAERAAAYLNIRPDIFEDKPVPTETTTARPISASRSGTESPPNQPMNPMSARSTISHRMFVAALSHENNEMTKAPPRVARQNRSPDNPKLRYLYGGTWDNHHPDRGK